MVSGILKRTLLGGFPASFIALSPSLPPRTPGLFHRGRKRNAHCILVSRPALPFVIHQTRYGAWHSTSLKWSCWAEHELGSPGMAKHKLKAPAELTASLVGWQMPRGCQGLLQLPSHRRVTSADQRLLRAPTFPQAIRHHELFSLLPPEQATCKQVQKPLAKPS